MNQPQFPGMNTNTGSSVRTTQRLTQAVFGWMFAGLIMTAIIAFVLGKNPEAVYLLNKAFFVILIAEIGVVWFLSARIGKMSVGAATFSFFLYAALNGLTFTAILSFYDASTIYMAFGVAAGMFGAFALVGAVTKIDLTKMGSLFLMALIGLIIASVVNIFVGSGTFSLILAYITVIIFCGLTAYDMQKIKRMGAYADQFGESGATKIAIMGALELYLDFINIFLALLRIFSRD